MTVARLVRVAGRVQGVFFRAWTRSEAEALGVSGWVCNLADGSVEALIEGEPIAVETLVDRLRRGPPDACVASVSVEECEPGANRGFVVRHD